MNVGIMLGKLVGTGEGRFPSARACCGALMGGGLSIDQLELIIAIAPTDAERRSSSSALPEFMKEYASRGGIS